MYKFQYLELENFKIFREKVHVEWRQLNAIVGLNGVGKSSLVDSIEFVCCFSKYNKTSVERLQQLLCNKSAKLYDYSRTCVKMSLAVDQKVTVFKRIADYNKSAHIYLVDEVEMTAAQYKKRLLECNINYNANNFLVQQSSIESIAIKNAKERGEFFELMSSSIAHKKQYDRLDKELKHFVQEADKLQKELKFHVNQMNKLAFSSKRLQEYEEQQKKLNKAEYDYFFARLYETDRSRDDLINDREKLLKLVKVGTKLLAEAESSITGLKRQLEDLKKSTNPIDKELSVVQKKQAKRASRMSILVSKLVHCRGTIDKVQKKLSIALKQLEARDKAIEDLERQYREVEELRSNHMAEMEGCSLTLNDEQYEEYLELKYQVEQKCIEELGAFDSVERACDVAKTTVENRKRDEESFSEKIERHKQQVEKLKSDLESINEKITKTESDEENTQKKIGQLVKDVENLLEKEKLLRTKIENLNIRISEMKYTKEEDKRSKRDTEILSRLKSHISGVFDRLKNLCGPSEDRYEVAITKIMGNKMNGIVVENERTGLECIKYLKEQYAGSKFSVVETYFPVNTVETKPYNKVLKAIQDEPDVKLALRVMDCDSEEIRRVVHHVVGNAVICNTDDQASDLCKRKNIDCVSLNGTYFKKDGTYSGGLATLLQKSKQWSIKEKENLQEELQRSIDESRTVMTEIKQKQEEKRKLEYKLNGLKQSLEKHLRPLYEDRQNEKEIKELKIKELEERLRLLRTQIPTENLCKNLEENNRKLETLVVQKNKIEDEVFANFCDNFNIDNIRKYEHGDYLKHKKYLDRKNEYDEHLSKIKHQIEYEKNRDIESNIRNLENHLVNLNKDYAESKVKEDQLKSKINSDKSDNEKKDEMMKNLRKKIVETERDLREKENHRKEIMSDLKKWSLSINNTETKISMLESEKHEILVECTINNINIPLQKGRIGNVLLKRKTDETVTDSSNSTPQSYQSSQVNEDDIEIDYAKLSKSIFNLQTDGLSNHIKSLKNEIESCKEELQNIQPDYSSKDYFDSMKKKVNDLKSDYKKQLDKLSLVKKEFNEVRDKRYKKFCEFFDAVSGKIDQIFKLLYKNNAAQANIILRNSEEPFLDGIEFNCVIPGKKCIATEKLSGGEKTMCAVSLLLAIFSVKPAPYLIFDEMDAALDKTNVEKIRDYFLQLKKSTQIIIISHNLFLSACADACIGINVQFHTKSSYVIHIDLTRYRSYPLSIGIKRRSKSTFDFKTFESSENQPRSTESISSF